MITLILYSYNGYIAHAFTDEQRVLLSSTLYVPKKSTEFFLPHIEQSCRILDIQPSSISRILCTNGPTNFTATRLILTTALAIAFPDRLPIATISSLSALAYGIPFDVENLWIIVQAQKTTVYAQSFSIQHINNTIVVQEQTPIVLYSHEQCIEQITRTSSPTILIDEPSLPHYLHLQHKYKLLAPSLAFPSIFALFQYAQSAHYHVEAPQPLYIRKTEPEENILNIAQKLGYSTDDVGERYLNR